MSGQIRAAGQAFEPVKQLACVLERLANRLEALEAQLDAGEDAWTPYLATINTLISVMDQAAPGSRGELITTRQMAERLGIAPKTLLRHKATGAVKPALQRGKLIRWRGDEAGR